MHETFEIRWFWESGLPRDFRTGLAGRWGRDLIDEGERTDTYLRLPGITHAGVKLREDQIECKCLAGRLTTRGCLPTEPRHWVKFGGGLPAAFALPPAVGDQWVDVKKRRLLAFWMLRDHQAEPAPQPSPDDGDAAHCQVELSEIEVEGVCWGSFCLEAAGPRVQATDLILQTAHRLVAGRNAPIDIAGAPPHQSYPEFLSAQEFRPPGSRVRLSRRRDEGG